MKAGAFIVQLSIETSQTVSKKQKLGVQNTQTCNVTKNVTEDTNGIVYMVQHVQLSAACR